MNHFSQTKILNTVTTDAHYTKGYKGFAGTFNRYGTF